MKIVFMASPDFALPALETLAASKHSIIGVVTGTDKVRGRGTKTTPTVIKQRALELGLPVIEADSMKDPDLEHRLRALSPDLFVVVAFKILPPSLLAIPRLGSVNIHASLLPKYRGAAPIHWAIIHGETSTGCTIFQLNEGIDEGRILARVETPIAENETTGDVYARLSQLGADLLIPTLDAIENGNIQPMAQDDTLATKAPKIFPADCEIDFRLDAPSVHNFIRGMSPFPGAWAMLDGLKFKILRTKRSHHSAQIPAGKMEFLDGELLVGCGKGCLILTEVQLEGKKAVSAQEFWRGYRGLAVLSGKL